MMIMLGIFLPITLVFGVAWRKPVPEVSQLPTGLAVHPQKFDAVEWTQDNFFPKAAIQARLIREQKGWGSYAMAFSAPKNFLKPDLLVYWIAGSSDGVGTLPNNAVLLGGFGPIPLPLPDAVTQSVGEVVLYSLADNEIVDISKPMKSVLAR
jgi:hypothetical protein